MYPGSNILNQALTVISQQTFQYLAFTANTLTSIGTKVPAYASPVTAAGSVQPVPKRLYQQYGLDLQKNYWNFFLPQSVIDIGRDVSSDKFTYNNAIYQCISLTPWYGVDGWVEVLTVIVPT